MSPRGLWTALRRIEPALRAVDHLAWWVSWQGRSTAGAGTRPFERDGGGCAVDDRKAA